jgi:hypothetical protein
MASNGMSYLFERMWKKAAVVHCMTLYKHLLKESKEQKKTSWLLARKRTIPTERPALVGEVSANIC